MSTPRAPRPRPALLAVRRSGHGPGAHASGPRTPATDMSAGRPSRVRPTAVALLAGTAALGALALAPVTAGAAAAATPHLTATPAALFAGNTTRLVGRGFAPDTDLTLRECGATNWIVPQPFCTRRAVTVHTGPRGGFRTSMVVTRCPHGLGRPRATSCWIGEPVGRGVDTVHLVGAVAVHVVLPVR